MSVHRRVYCVPRAYNTVEKEKQKKNYNAVSSARYIRVGGHICTVVVRVLYTHYAYGIPLRTTVYTIYLYTGRIIYCVRGYKLYSTATVCRYCLHQCTLLRYCDIIVCKRYRLRQLFAHDTPPSALPLSLSSAALDSSSAYASRPFAIPTASFVHIRLYNVIVDEVRILMHEVL